jgi:hypothetical protein
MNHTRPSGARQDCHHAKAQFDAYFREALKGRGLTSDDKAVYAYLVSGMRKSKGAPVAATIAEIAAECEISYHHTWTALKHLAEQQLVKKVRRGLGLSNTYELLPVPGVLDTEDIVGKAPPESAVRPAGGKQSGQPGSPARAYLPAQRKDERSRTTGTRYKDFDASNYFETSEGYIVCRG